MFIRIGILRIKLSSVQEYKKGLHSTTTGKWYLDMKVSGRERKISFDTEQELDDVLANLDVAMKVQVI